MTLRHYDRLLSGNVAGPAGPSGPSATVVGSGQIAVTESPAGTFTVASGLLNSLATRTFKMHKMLADASAGVDTIEIPIHEPFTSSHRLSGVKYYPNSGLTAHATNYVTMSIRLRSTVDGSDGGYLAFAASTPSGDGATGNWAAHRPVQFTFVDDANQYELTAGYVMCWSAIKVGSGVPVPPGLLVVTCEPWTESE